MTRLWDISQTLDPATPVWPGTPSLTMERVAEISAACPVNVSVMTLGTHTGSHADAPLHYRTAGAASADCPLEPYIGPCIVIDVRHARRSVTTADFDESLVKNARRVIFRTYDRFPERVWDSGFTAIDATVIDLLGRNGVILVGTDAPSLDPETSKSLDAHQRVSAFDMRILEGLVLDEVAAGDYELIALPLKLGGGDASPVRAILRKL